MNERARHTSGIIGTIIFHGVILIIFLLLGFSKPEPIPGEEGILVNFGEQQTGSGPTEPQTNQVNQVAEKESAPQPTPDQSGEKDIMTQDYQEAPAAQEKEKETPEEPKEKTETPEKKQQETREQEQEKKEQPTVNNKALYKGQSDNKNADSEGITEGEGNQGSPTGTENADNYANADSRGKGGVSYSLEGRNPQSLPKPEYQFQKEGKVVVEVKVNQEGKVISANPGVKGSTTLDDYLLKVAKKAALRSTFNTDPDAPKYQKGTISYYFKLK